jgi:hypothetical protein
MGGKALGVRLAPLDRARHAEVVAALLPTLRAFYARVAVPATFACKDAFGDVDVLVAAPLGRRPFDPAVDAGSSAARRNGHVLSFEFRGHQVDLLSCGPTAAEFELLEFCAAYGDVGMIVGMMARVLGLRFGFRGLWLAAAGGRRVTLSRDLGAILRFLDLDVAAYRAGLADEGAAFAWLSASRRFRPSMFRRREGWTADQRDRFVRRPMFRRFVLRCEAEACAEEAGAEEAGAEAGAERFSASKHSSAASRDALVLKTSLNEYAPCHSEYDTSTRSRTASCTGCPRSRAAPSARSTATCCWAPRGTCTAAASRRPSCWARGRRRT